MARCWRTPRSSDAIDQLFWIDDEGPVAGVVLTDWGSAWGCDLIVVPGVTTLPLPALRRRAVEAIDALWIASVEVPELASWLATQVRAGEAVATHAALQSWMDENSGGKPVKTPRRVAARR